MAAKVQVGLPHEVEVETLYRLIAWYVVYSSEEKGLLLDALDRQVDALARLVLPLVRLKPAHAPGEGVSLRDYILQGGMSFEQYVDSSLPPVVERNRETNACSLEESAGAWFYGEDTRPYASVMDLIEKAARQLARQVHTSQAGQDHTDQ